MFNAVFYRGRLDGSAKLLIIGQDPSTDESIASRAFVGTAGQRLQHFLNKIAITKSYLIVNTFVYGNTASSANLKLNSEEAPIANFRNRILDKALAENSIEQVITLGRVAEHAFKKYPNYATYRDIHTYMTHPTADDRFIVNNWNKALRDLSPIITADDVSFADPSRYAEPIDDTYLTNIPRDRSAIYDSVLAWH